MVWNVQFSSIWWRIMYISSIKLTSIETFHPSLHILCNSFIHQGNNYAQAFIHQHAIGKSKIKMRAVKLWKNNNWPHSQWDFAISAKVEPHSATKPHEFDLTLILTNYSCMYNTCRFWFQNEHSEYIHWF